MNKPSFDTALIAPYRAEIETWNLMGRKLLTVKVEPADLEFNDKVRKNELRLVRPIMKYIIEEIEIFGSQIVCLPDGVTPVIELNNDPSLQFKIGPAKFNEVTTDTIRQAVEFNSKTSIAGREPIFFTDYLALVEQVNRLNGFEMEKANQIAEEMLNLSKMLQDLYNLQTTNCDKYYDEIGTPLKK